MKIKILALALVIIALLPGCGSTPEETQPADQQTQAATTEATSDISQTTEPVATTAPAEDVPPIKEEVYDTYHSGKPYVPWGTAQTFTLRSEMGQSLTFSGNVPEDPSGVQNYSWLWWSSTNDLNTSYMLTYIDQAKCSVKSPETFFEDMGDDFAESYYKKFKLPAKDAVIDIRDSVSVSKNGIRMCRFVGVAQWHVNKTPKEDSFVAYVFQAPDGGYLCCLFQCMKKDWTTTQEAAENFINTFSWRDTNAS